MATCSTIYRRYHSALPSLTEVHADPRPMMPIREDTAPGDSTHHDGTLAQENELVTMSIHCGATSS